MVKNLIILIMERFNKKLVLLYVVFFFMMWFTRAQETTTQRLVFKTLPSLSASSADDFLVVDENNGRTKRIDLAGLVSRVEAISPILSAEEIQDMLAPVFTNGNNTGLTVTYNDAANVFNFTATANDGSETKITAGDNIIITGSGTIASPYVIQSTGGSGSGVTQSEVESIIGSRVVAGTGISTVFNSGTRETTISISGEEFTSAEKSKLSGISSGATVGANWQSNLTNIPADIADGDDVLSSGDVIAIVDGDGFIKSGDETDPVFTAADFNILHKTGNESFGGTKEALSSFLVNGSLFLNNDGDTSGGAIYMNDDNTSFGVSATAGNRIFFNDGNLSWMNKNQTTTPAQGARFIQNNTGIRDYTFRDRPGVVAFTDELGGFRTATQSEFNAMTNAEKEGWIFIEESGPVDEIDLSSIRKWNYKDITGDIYTPTASTTDSIVRINHTSETIIDIPNPPFPNGYAQTFRQDSINPLKFAVRDYRKDVYWQTTGEGALITMIKEAGGYTFECGMCETYEYMQDLFNSNNSPISAKQEGTDLTIFDDANFSFVIKNSGDTPAPFGGTYGVEYTVIDASSGYVSDLIPVGFTFQQNTEYTIVVKARAISGSEWGVQMHSNNWSVTDVESFVSGQDDTIVLHGTTRSDATFDTLRLYADNIVNGSKLLLGEVQIYLGNVTIN